MIFRYFRTQYLKSYTAILNSNLVKSHEIYENAQKSTQTTINRFNMAATISNSKFREKNCVFTRLNFSATIYSKCIFILFLVNKIETFYNQTLIL